MKNLDDYRLLAAEWACTWVGQERPSDEETTTQWRCNKEGHEWQTSYSRFQGCRKCVVNSTKNEEDYRFLAELRLFRWVGDELPDNTKTKTLWVCMVEEHKFYMSYYNVRRGTKCPHCRKRTEES